MAVFPSQKKRDGKYYLYAIVGSTKRTVFLNDLSILGPCEMDVMLQCEGIVSSKNASGQATHTIKVGIVSTRVQSLPADFVYNPAKSFINKHKEIFRYNHSITIKSSVCLLKKKNFF